MRALILDGALEGGTYLDIMGEVLRTELESRGCDVRSLTLRGMKIRPCQGCFGCWKKTPGDCVIRDEGRDVLREVVGSDIVVYLTPVTFGGYSSALKGAIDRFACPVLLPFFITIDGEVHHPARYERRHRLIGLGLIGRRETASEEIFASLVKRNAINQHARTAATLIAAPDSDETTLKGRIGTLLEEALA